MFTRSSVHAGHGAEQRPRIARVRDLASSSCVKFVAVPIALVSMIGESPLDGDRLLHAADAHRERQLDVGRPTTTTASRSNVAKPEARRSPCRYRAATLRNRYCPSAAGDERRRAVGPGERHRHARQHARPARPGRVRRSCRSALALLPSPRSRGMRGRRGTPAAGRIELLVPCVPLVLCSFDEGTREVRAPCIC